MPKEIVFVEENFGLLLDWLDCNREIAAQKYEKIRARLIRIFAGRGCFTDAEELADETFDRVTRKLPQLADDYTGDPSLYFYGVADKIHLEWLRNQKKKTLFHLPETEQDEQTGEFEIEYECLEKCLKKLPASDRLLIVGYYEKEKSAKIENRRQLADSFGISAGALQIKASRIRAPLRICT